MVGLKSFATRPWFYLCFLLFATICLTSVVAQEDLDAALGGDSPSTTAVAAPDAPAGGEAESTPSAPKQESLLMWTFQALGISYTVIFLALSITLLTLIVMSMISARRENVCPQDLIDGVNQQLDAGNPQAAAELVRTDDSFLGQVIAAGLSKLSKGHSHAVEAMQEVGEEETMKLDHSLSYIALIGSISPMIGLLGTVQGMIGAFRQIAFSGSTPKPEMLAKDIATALFTTLAGLVVAIPAIAIYGILRNRVQRLTLQVGVTSEDILEKFQR